MSRNPLSLWLAAALALLAAHDAWAQVSEPAPERPSARSFLARHGDGWIVAPAAVTGQPTFVYGGRLTLPIAPRTEAAFVAAARQLVDQETEMLGLDSSQLVLDRVKLLPLSGVGSSDKIAVTFRQEVAGVEVQNGTVTILFDAASGDVLAIDTTAVPFADRVATEPRASADEALEAADRSFVEEFGIGAASVDDTTLVVVGPSAFFGWKNPLTDRGPALAWRFDLSTPGAYRDGLPVQARVWVSAEGDGTVFKLMRTAFAADGTVRGNVNIGQEPNTPTNQENPALPHMWVRLNSASGQIVATTDANGFYSTGSANPQTLFFELRGPFVNVNNNAGPDSSITLTNATGSGNDVQFNPTKAEFPTAEVAGFYWVNRFRDWVVSVDPTDTTMDFSVLCNVNKNDLTCNAYFNGSSINLERADGSCANTAYSDVILHEEGHWANVRYNGNVTGAFHEGNADAFAYYINDDPCLNHFIGSGCLRNGLQTSIKKCPTDGDESCHGGEVHTEGQALASAFWAVRANLNASLGNAQGDAVADALFLGWLNTFNDGAILNVIQDHWIALDDDDGDLSNGTPHFAEIVTGFAAYGWPAPPDVTLSVTQAPSTNQALVDGQPATIRATITSQAGTINSARIVYAVNGGANQQVVMSQTANPSVYVGQIPGLPSPSTVVWHVEATSTAGGSAQSTEDIYHVGVVNIVASYDFDGPTDEGWTHVNLSGQWGDQWHRADPAGSNEPTDPDQAFSSPNVWGTDLSVPGWDGKYEPNSSGELRSPSFNLSGAQNVHIQYRRWLAVEEAQFDQAQIRVNGQVVWQNATNGHHIDTEWALHDLDVTAIAAGNPSVQVAYRLTSDGGLEFGGWNIDDFVIYSVEPSTPGSFQVYGTGCPGTGGVTPQLTGQGTVLPLQTVTLQVSGGQPNAQGLLLLGTQQANVDVGAGCTLLVGGLIGGGLPLTLDGQGGAQLAGQLPGGVTGYDVFFQFFGADAGAANGAYSASNGLQMHVP